MAVRCVVVLAAGVLYGAVGLLGVRLVWWAGDLVNWLRVSALGSLMPGVAEAGTAAVVGSHGVGGVFGSGGRFVEAVHLGDRPYTAVERRAVRKLVLVVVFLVVACGGEVNPLAGTSWRLVDSSGVPVEGDVTAEFSATELTGWTGCNSYTAGYSVRGSELHLTDLKWTERGCPSDDLFTQEQQVLALWISVERFEMAGEQLTLHTEAGYVSVFERVGS